MNPEIIATIQSAQALSHFANYIKSLDDRLTLSDATAVAAAVVNALPHLFMANPNLINVIKTQIAEVYEESE